VIFGNTALAPNPIDLRDGKWLLANGSAEDTAIVRDELLLEAADARTDIKKFFDFVMREQTTRRPITALPHQRVALDFVMDHQRSLLVMPPGFSKTFMLTAICLFIMGHEPTMRGLFVSATRAQSEKVLAVIRGYIENSQELRLVFPGLVPTRRQGEKWTQHALTVDRPAGINDPTLVAVGLDSESIAGSRLNFVVADDLLTEENTGTKDQRDDIYNWFAQILRTRLDPGHNMSKLVVINTPWHHDDLVARLEMRGPEGAGSATLKMDVYGDITVLDDETGPEQAADEGKEWEPWDSDELRPRSPGDASDPICRLVAHDPDNDNQKPLWPGKFGVKEINQIQRTTLENIFLRNYRLLVRDDATAMCPLSYVEKGKLRAHQLGYDQMGAALVRRHQDMNTFTGVDLAVRQGEANDKVAFFTFGVVPSTAQVGAQMLRLVLDVEEGQWPAHVILEKVILKHVLYGSSIMVENNAAQEYIVQMFDSPEIMKAVIEKLRREGHNVPEDIAIPVRGYTTGSQKANPTFGVPSIFLEMSHGGWLFPCREEGGKLVCTYPLQRALDQAMNYRPEEHTGDALMAWWFAKELARKWGLLTYLGEDGGGGVGSVMQR